MGPREKKIFSSTLKKKRFIFFFLLLSANLGPLPVCRPPKLFPFIYLRLDKAHSTLFKLLPGLEHGNNRLWPHWYRLTSPQTSTSGAAEGVNPRQAGEDGEASSKPWHMKPSMTWNHTFFPMKTVADPWRVDSEVFLNLALFCRWDGLIIFVASLSHVLDYKTWILAFKAWLSVGPILSTEAGQIRSGPVS